MARPSSGRPVPLKEFGRLSGNHGILACLDPQERHGASRWIEYRVVSDIRSGERTQPEWRQPPDNSRPHRPGVFADATGENQGVESRQRRGCRRDASRGSGDEHVDGELGAFVSLPRGFLEILHPDRAPRYADQSRTVIECALEFAPAGPSRAQHI